MVSHIRPSKSVSPVEQAKIDSTKRESVGSSAAVTEVDGVDSRSTMGKMLLYLGVAIVYGWIFGVMVSEWWGYVMFLALLVAFWGVCFESEKKSTSPVGQGIEASIDSSIKRESGGSVAATEVVDLDDDSSDNASCDSDSERTQLLMEP